MFVTVKSLHMWKNHSNTAAVQYAKLLLFCCQYFCNSGKLYYEFLIKKHEMLHCSVL